MTEQNYAPCPPCWQTMFAHAVRIAKTEVDPDSGQQLIVEMLEFGQRLEAASREASALQDTMMHALRAAECELACQRPGACHPEAWDAAHATVRAAMEEVGHE